MSQNTMTLKELKNYTQGPCVIVLIGPSGAGKSTLAQELANEDHEIISSDQFRELLSGDVAEQSVTGIVFQLIYDVINVRSNYQCRTILDATNLKRRNRKAYYGPVSEGIPSYAILVEAGEQTCKDRQNLRDRQVPEHVIERHHNTFKHAKQNVVEETERWDGVFCYNTEEGDVKILR